MMAGIGLYLDSSGKVPSNRMLDAYKDEENMRRIWEEITKFAVEHKPWIKQFWNDADAQINGFMQNDEIGRAHVCTPVTNAHLVCRLLLEKKKTKNKCTTRMPQYTR